jgi:hypothetical protein
LVLLDGDVFHDDLYRKGCDGGTTAARLLEVAVSQKVRSLGLDDSCRVMVRVFADLRALSRAGMKTKVCGGDSRALARFFAGFNQANELFDFVDAGMSTDSVYAKIRATLNISLDNPQCRHIFLGSTTRPELVDELHQRHRHRITLLKSHSFHRDLIDLDLRVERLPTILRSVPFGEEDQRESSPPPRSESTFAKALRSGGSTTVPTTTATAVEAKSNAKLCHFFMKGICRYGDECYDLHDPSSTANGGTSQKTKNSSLDSDWRSKSATTTTSIAGSTDFALELPHDDHMPTDQIPVNAVDHRLDSYILPPSLDDRHAFAARIAKRKLCNQFHLSGDCSDQNCIYDHFAISAGVRTCLKEAARMTPCPRRGKCRLINCNFGHICQTAKCYAGNNRPWCKLPGTAHHTPIQLDRWEPALSRDGSNGAARSATNASRDSSAQRTAATSPANFAALIDHDEENLLGDATDDDDDDGDSIPSNGHSHRSHLSPTPPSPSMKPMTADDEEDAETGESHQHVRADQDLDRQQQRRVAAIALQQEREAQREEARRLVAVQLQRDAEAQEYREAEAQRQRDAEAQAQSTSIYGQPISLQEW